MSNPANSDERRNLLKLLDRLAAVDRQAAPRLMGDLVVGQWLHGDADTRQKIEDAVDRAPKKSS
jgi:hypothetical protein